MTHPLETVKEAFLQIVDTSRNKDFAEKYTAESALRDLSSITEISNETLSTLTTYMGQTQYCTECERLTREWRWSRMNNEKITEENEAIRAENAALRAAVRVLDAHITPEQRQYSESYKKHATIIKKSEGE